MGKNVLSPRSLIDSAHTWLLRPSQVRRLGCAPAGSLASGLVVRGRPALVDLLLPHALTSGV